jgi:hypothetical protein
MTLDHSQTAIERARVFQPENGDPPRPNTLAMDAILPAVGLDNEGMPAIGHLASLEEQARHRFSPRRALWPELARFEGQLTELEARHRETISASADAQAQLRSVDRRDAQALARWELDGRRGEKPEAEEPALKEQVADLERERDGLAGAIAQVLADKAAFVTKNRARLTATASRLVGEAKASYIDAVERMAAARAELVDLRLTELWACVFPDEAAARMPRTDHLALGARSLYPPSLADRALDADGVIALLRTDAEAVTTSMSTAQRVVIQNLDPRQPPGTQWDAAPRSAEQQQAPQQEMVALREAAARELGVRPDAVTELQVEGYLRELQAGRMA